MELVRAPLPAGIPQSARRNHPVPPARGRSIWARSSTSRSRGSGKLLEDRKIRLDLTDGARAWLGRVGYDPVYGARPLKRAVQKYLQDPLADKILSGEVADGSVIRVDEGEGTAGVDAAFRKPLKSGGVNSASKPFFTAGSRRAERWRSTRCGRARSVASSARGTRRPRTCPVSRSSRRISARSIWRSSFETRRVPGWLTGFVASAIGGRLLPPADRLKPWSEVREQSAG